MQELIDTLLNYLLTTPYGQYVTLTVFAMFVVQQVLPHLPPNITSKIPNWIMVIINVIAGRYKHTENKNTDIKGNIK
jgi:uncharacterized membrane protein YqgA involved in biofilm formation